MPSKDWKSIHKELRKQGWVVTIAPGGHIKAVPPDKAKDIVFLSKTPSDQKAIDKALGDLRRSGFRWQR